MGEKKKLLTAVALVIGSGSGVADDLTLPLQKHTVNCPSTAVCMMRKPTGIGGWELLSTDVTLEEKGDGRWLADFSKVKSARSGKALLRILTADGQLVDVEATLPKGRK